MRSFVSVISLVSLTSSVDVQSPTLPAVTGLKLTGWWAKKKGEAAEHEHDERTQEEQVPEIAVGDNPCLENGLVGKRPKKQFAAQWGWTDKLSAEKLKFGANDDWICGMDQPYLRDTLKNHCIAKFFQKKPLSDPVRTASVFSPEQVGLIFGDFLWGPRQVKDGSGRTDYEWAGRFLDHLSDGRGKKYASSCKKRLERDGTLADREACEAFKTVQFLKRRGLFGSILDDWQESHVIGKPEEMFHPVFWTVASLFSSKLDGLSKLTNDQLHRIEASEEDSEELEKEWQQTNNKVVQDWIELTNLVSSGMYDLMDTISYSDSE
jgi:hypothetical protein